MMASFNEDFTWVDKDFYLAGREIYDHDRASLVDGWVAGAVTRIAEADCVWAGSTRAVLSRLRAVYSLSLNEWPMTEQQLGDALEAAADAIAGCGVRLLCLPLDSAPPRLLIWFFLAEPIGQPPYLDIRY